MPACRQFVHFFLAVVLLVSACDSADQEPQPERSAPEEVPVLAATSDTATLPDRAVLAIMRDAMGMNSEESLERWLVLDELLISPDIPLDRPYAFRPHEPSPALADSLSELGVERCRVVGDVVCPELRQEPPAQLLVLTGGRPTEEGGFQTGFVLVGTEPGWSATGFRVTVVPEAEPEGWSVQDIDLWFAEN